ncbi:glutathionylspermidine synthase family protein [Curtobacterium sp. RHCJP20]|uniref:Glutathionylspermidine synthase family protein n=1 Tax=Curtobacterium subtropicum TaxID=3055138 RepID=A0ABT7TEI0_9MICO|nr:glutathionylspermidine synthase family protein [Curtobacterium subtropicum]MDM7887990.1 glutathionylspermidine synthase family protein [Curtobacterium subtropicum]
MERVEFTPRADWRRRIQQTGLVYSHSVREDGTDVEYWNEGAAYVFTLPEVEALERQTEELHGMCLEAARYMASGELGTLGLTRDGFELAAWSLEQAEPDVYARFDLAYAGDGSPAKLLEYNGDTPTGLIEASVTQWHWMRERVESGELPADTDQWNGIHEALVARWRTLLHESLRSEDGGRLFVAHSDLDTAGEDWDTVAYMRDLAAEAGWEHTGIEMKDIGWHGIARQFVGNQEPAGSARSVFTLPGDEPGTQWPVIRNLFKLYPWEDLVSGDDRATGDQEFGAFLVSDRGRLGHWYEPAWKMFLSNKLLLVALWRLFPGHENLLPSYADGPNGMTDFVVKPVFGREGDGITVHRADGSATSNGSEYRRAGTSGERVWQQYHELPDFPGSNGHNHPVLGSWVVDGESFGVGIRESDGPITDYWCRFAPNLIRQS